MPNKRKKRTFWKNIKFKYKLTIFNENTLEEVVAIHVSKLNGLAVLLSTLFVIFLITALIIIWSPLRNYLPGYMNSSVRQQIVVNALRVDSLEKQLLLHRRFTQNIQDILTGKVPNDTALTKELSPVLSKDTLLAPTEAELSFREQYEDKERYQLSSASILPDVGQLSFFKPVSGNVVQSFQPEQKAFGLRIWTKPNENIHAVLGGTVLLSTYTAKDGYTIVIQHAQHFVSVYKQCRLLLKEEGNLVLKGEVVGIAPSSKSASNIIQFELWHKGTPINPSLYLSF